MSTEDMFYTCRFGWGGALLLGTTTTTTPPIFVVW